MLEKYKLTDEEINLITSPTINMKPPISRAVDFNATRMARERTIAEAQLKKIEDNLKVIFEVADEIEKAEDCYSKALYGKPVKPDSPVGKAIKLLKELQ